jgi:glucose/arabinose dehydrogenase
MKVLRYAVAAILALTVGSVSASAFAQDRAKAEPAGPAGKWSTRSPVTPDPSKIVVPPGYKVGVFASGLDTITSIAVDKSDNVWVAISGNTFGFPPEGIDKPHVKIYDRSGKLIRDRVGLGVFKSFALNEIGYCAENGRTYVGDYSYGIWEIDGVQGEPKLIMNEVPIGDHALGGIMCRDGWLYYAVGAPSNSGFSDPDIHGWTDAVDPYWEKRTPAGVPPLPRDPPCRDIVLTGLNIRDSQGNLTGSYLPKGTPSKPGQVIRAQKPCGGAIHRARLKADSNYSVDDWEVYAMGFRNMSGVAFGPKGSRFENALAVSDNGQNDKGNRRVANGSEKLFIVTEKGQDAGFPDKEGLNFVNIKRFGPDTYRGNRFDSTRPNPQLYIGDKPYIPQLPPYRFIDHSIGVRGTPLIVANRNPNGYINPVMEWDTNNPMDGLAWSPKAFGATDTIFTAVFGIIDNGPESLTAMWPAIVKIEFLNPTGIKWSIFAQNIEPGPNAYQKKENRGGFERTNDVEFSNDGKTMYVADYGELYVNYQMESPFYTTPKSAVVWTITKQ